MDLGLAGRVALVTGASRGIGRGIAEALAAEGARVALAARSTDQVTALAAGLGGRGYHFDSARPQDADELLAAVQADLGPIDIYVANTGGPPRTESVLAVQPEQLEQAHAVLLSSPLRMLAQLVPGMRARGFGRVLVVSSSAAREPIAGLTLSNAHRPGLLAVVKELAREVAADGVTVNAVLPGRIATARIVEGYGDLETAEAVARREVPAGRLGTVAEIAAAAAFLCSAPASYITGAALLVDGGLTHGW